MKIYTKSGDGGETGLFGGGRVRKSDHRVEAYGEVDEANAAVGAARAAFTPADRLADLDAELARVQDELFCVGAELASPHGVKARAAVPPLQGAWVERLELAIDRWEAELPPLTRFVLPGGTPAAAGLHLARAATKSRSARWRWSTSTASPTCSSWRRGSPTTGPGGPSSTGIRGRRASRWLRGGRQPGGSRSSPGPGCASGRPSRATSRARATRSPPTTGATPNVRKNPSLTRAPLTGSVPSGVVIR